MAKERLPPEIRAYFVEMGRIGGLARAAKLTPGAAKSKGDVYYNKIQLKVMADVITIAGGFSEQHSVAAILGRHGFFENFIVTFDPCAQPPGLLVQRLHRV